MSTTVSIDDLLDFLARAGRQGLMPIATTQALAVAVRTVFAVLDADEQAAIPLERLDSIVTRFGRRRAHDFNPTTLREYARRARRAIDLHAQWRADPDRFAPTTRATRGGGARTAYDATDRTSTLGVAESLRSPRDDDASVPREIAGASESGAMPRGDRYTTHFPVRPGSVITIADVPFDLTSHEAERLVAFVKLLARE